MGKLKINLQIKYSKILQIYWIIIKLIIKKINFFKQLKILLTD